MIVQCRNLGNLKYLIYGESPDAVTLTFFRKDYEQVHQDIPLNKAREIIDRKILHELKTGR